MGEIYSTDTQAAEIQDKAEEIRILFTSGRSNFYCPFESFLNDVGADLKLFQLGTAMTEGT